MPTRVKLSLSRCLRVFVMGLDAFFALIGLMTVMLAVICYALPYLHEFSHALNKVISVNMLVIGTMVIGLVFLVIGSVGCYGAYCRNPFYLGIHIGVMLVMYMFQAVIVYAFRREWEEKLSLGVSFGVMDYDPDDPQRRYMDGIQRVLDCCGGSSPIDYRFNVHFNKRTVPLSCCKSHVPELLAKCEQTETGSIPIALANELGCRNRLHNLLWPCILSVVVSLGALGFCCILFPSIYIYILHLIEEEEKAEEALENEEREEADEDEGEDKLDEVPLFASAIPSPTGKSVNIGVEKMEVAIQVNRGTEDALDQLQVLAQRIAGLDVNPATSRANRAMRLHSYGGESMSVVRRTNEGYQHQPLSNHRALSVWDGRSAVQARAWGQNYPKFRESFG